MAFLRPSSQSAIPQCLILSLALALLLQTCLAQNYHFSNGWYAGKKRSSPTSRSGATSDAGGPSTTGGPGSSTAFDEGCSMRPEALALIAKIVQEEAARMQKTCVSSASMALQDYLEGAARKLAGDNKW